MSKGLEALEKIDNTLCLNLNNGTLKFGLDKYDNCDCKDLKEFDECYEIIEKSLKALEIIKEKRVDVSWLHKCFNFIENCSIEDELDYYNNNYEAYRNSKPLTLEEHRLLREVLL